MNPLHQGEDLIHGNSGILRAAQHEQLNARCGGRSGLFRESILDYSILLYYNNLTNFAEKRRIRAHGESLWYLLIFSLSISSSPCA